MLRKPNLDRIEPDRKRKRIAVALSAADAGAVTQISAVRGVPSSRVVAYMIRGGMEIEQRGRIILDRPKWPTHPADPRYVQAAFDPLDFLDLVELAETTFEPLNVTASALFKLGLAAYQQEHSLQVPSREFEFGSVKLQPHVKWSLVRVPQLTDCRSIKNILDHAGISLLVPHHLSMQLMVVLGRGINQCRSVFSRHLRSLE